MNVYCIIRMSCVLLWFCICAWLCVHLLLLIFTYACEWTLIHHVTFSSPPVVVSFTGCSVNKFTVFFIFLTTSASFSTVCIVFIKMISYGFLKLKCKWWCITLCPCFTLRYMHCLPNISCKCYVIKVIQCCRRKGYKASLIDTLLS